MKLSIVIVNYNVKHFLAQCLHSVEKALIKIPSEVFVVDNNSADGSCEMLKAEFKNIKLIENKENLGFSKANNQAIKKAKGEYVLLLNPDTVVEEDTFKKVVDFMDKHQDAGGLGVKMIDGKGAFLPESKRGLPTPDVAFYKIFGLSKIFKKSKKFGKYHLTYLDKNQNHEVDVLSGAFMMLRKSVLDKIGYLDEDFFMYGEDIDLSYRITKAGYKNYYFSDTTIIHYKGESTKKGSINYVMVFYNAMIIFANKHFSNQNAKTFSTIINLAIYFRAFLSILKRFVQKTLLPISDFALTFGGAYFLKSYWENLKFHATGIYPETYLELVLPTYIVIRIIAVFFAGGYDKPIKLIKFIKGIIIGSLFILVFYSLLNETYRFSRALILLNSAWALTAGIAIRFIYHFILKGDFKIQFKTGKRVILVGNKTETQRISNLLLKETSINLKLIGSVYPKNEADKNGLGSVENLKEIVKINKVDEIIFCASDIQANDIIKNMLDLSEMNLEYKIASADSLSVIGSNSIDTAGELYTVNLNSIGKNNNKRNKALLDIVLSILFIPLYPFLILIIKNPGNFLLNIFRVLFRKLSWIGYTPGFSASELPKIKNGIISPINAYNRKEINDDLIQKINYSYAKDYSIKKDLRIIRKGLKFLGG